jgi:DTW domain-containing protein YfiP
VSTICEPCMLPPVRETRVGPGPRAARSAPCRERRTDLRLNQHLHLIVLDGTWFEKDGELA